MLISLNTDPLKEHSSLSPVQINPAKAKFRPLECDHEKIV